MLNEFFGEKKYRKIINVINFNGNKNIFGNFYYGRILCQCFHHLILLFQIVDKL